jgi:hypothetical protein
MKINPKPEIHEFNDGGVTHRMHIWDATPESHYMPPKNTTKKTIKEEVVGSAAVTGTGTGDVRGLGTLTGSPAVNPNQIANYVDHNTADSDNKNNILGMHGGKDHGTTHNMVGFKAFNPKEHRSLRKVKKDGNI